MYEDGISVRVVVFGNCGCCGIELLTGGPIIVGRNYDYCSTHCWNVGPKKKVYERTPRGLAEQNRNRAGDMECNVACSVKVNFIK